MSVGDGDALEVVKADVADLEGEEGGDGFACAVAKVVDGFCGVATADASGGDEEFFAAVGLSEAGVDFEAVFDDFDISYATTGAPNDAVISGGVDEAVDDGF